MTKFAIFGAVAGLAVAMGLGGCGSNSGASGVTTASVLDGGQRADDTDGPKIANTDPMARPIQVAWTAARAKKCGFNFNPAGLKANYMAAEQQMSVPNLPQLDKTYDQTFSTVSAQIAGRSDYCTEKKNAIIKADLMRHLGGDFTPNLPQPKSAAPAKGWFETDEDGKREEKLDPNTFWREQQAKKDGVKSGG